MEFESSERHEDSHHYRRSPDSGNDLSSSDRHLSPEILSHNQYTPPMNNDDDALYSHGFGRDGSQTPPTFSYHTYPAPDDILYPPYSQRYPQMVSNAQTESYSEYLAPVPTTLPGLMLYGNSGKSTSLLHADDNTMNPFNMSYATMAGIDVHAPRQFDDSNPHVCTQSSWR
jgi:hypothetical protein